MALLEPSGRVVRELETDLRDVHLMEFTVAGDVAYAFGDCVKGAGLARVPLRGSARMVVREACGDTATLLHDSTLVLGRRRTRDAYGRGGSDAALVFVDLKARKLENSVQLPEDPADVLAVG